MILLFAFQLSAQHKCGLSPETGAQIRDQIFKNRAEMRDFVRPRNTTTYVPVRFYMVAKSNGSERTSELVALKGLCRMNENYADQDIQFYLKEFKYLNSNSIHDNPGSNTAYNSIRNSMVYDAINIFIVANIGFDENVAAYYQGPASGPNRADWIVSNDNFADDFTTLTHEVGHYFSLQHPWYGWEEQAYDEAIHGNPVGFNSPAGASIKNEWVNGENCMTAGDMICDTPADYRFDFPGPDNCTYVGNVKDPNGELISPDPTNFMNYADCTNSLYHFTPDQKAAISMSLFSSSRDYLPSELTPVLGEVTSSPTLISPQNLETVATYNSVELEWADLDNADQYYLELSKVGGGTERYILNDTKVTLTNLEPNSSYFWKVMGFNSFYTCGNTTGNRIVKTGSDTVLDTNDIPGLEEWTVRPNPVRSGSTLILLVNSNSGITVDARLSTVTGQTIAYMPDQVLGNGTSTIEIDTYGLPAGIYLVSLQTADGLETRRVSIF